MPSTRPPNFPWTYGLLDSTKGSGREQGGTQTLPVWDIEQRPCTKGPAVNGTKEIQKTETAEQKCLLYFGNLFFSILFLSYVSKPILIIHLCTLFRSCVLQYFCTCWVLLLTAKENNYIRHIYVQCFVFTSPGSCNCSAHMGQAPRPVDEIY